MNKTDFDFTFRGFGHYKVSYTNPKTLEVFTALVTDMELIDRVRLVDTPKRVDLIKLKNTCKL